MRHNTKAEPAEWSVTKDGLSWLDVHDRPLQVDPATGRLMVGAVVIHNGSRDYWGAGQTVGYTPKASKLRREALGRVRAAGKRLTTEAANRIMDEALEAALRAARLGQLALPVEG